MSREAMSARETHEIRVRGAVQGVGFRPTVFRLAAEDNLVGEVLNDSEGVLIRVSGSRNGLQQFTRKLNSESPPLAKIDEIESRVLGDHRVFKEFRILKSEKGVTTTEISADAATCHACLEELFDIDERRFQYPFTNCTHCGPRLSIVKRIPYDRETSTMEPFFMCKACRAEYENPLDRRFHAQPIACFDCGPNIALHDFSEEHISGAVAAQHSRNTIAQIKQALCDGKIIAIKGLGGFHLCCDAANHNAVKMLRERKRRYAKPFALMTHDVSLIEQYCELSELEREELCNNKAPIVLLDRQQDLAEDVPRLSSEIAPGSDLYGFMLPYTPLHWLVVKGFGRPLVMTSGNLSGEPQVIDNLIATKQLKGIADLVLYHDREIANRIDDSVVRCMAGKARIIRRARGYAPRSIRLPATFANGPQIMACGAELKSTFCLVKNGNATLSQHQGDLENVSTFDDYMHNLALYEQLYESQPEIIALDAHPEYISSKFARETLSQRFPDAYLEEIQHHHAHIASCMVENELALESPPVLGVALDGLGFGSDQALWGGEFLLADYQDFRRLARLRPVVMPGGAQAIKQPWRNTWAHICDAMPWSQFKTNYADLELTRFLNDQPLDLLERMREQQLNSPAASSCGRLFDAVAAALNLSRERALYEGQGAVELEMRAKRAWRGSESSAYSFGIKCRTGEPEYELEAASLWTALLEDLLANVSVDTIAARFHRGLINGLLNMITHLAEKHQFATVAVSGGCLQNKLLLEGLQSGIEAQGFRYLTHSRVPANDGGIALGQAAIASARAMSKAAQKNSIKTK